MIKMIGLTTLMGQSAPDKPDTPASPRRLGLGQSLLLGGGFAGGGTIVLAVIQFARSKPEQAFALLHDWGPWVFLSMLIAWVLGQVINRALGIAERVGDRLADSLDNVAEQQRSQAEAGHAQALAMQAMADKDDRDKQEMQVLIGVVNNKVDLMGRTLDRIEAALQTNRE